jgi:hypothetical protein
MGSLHASSKVLRITVFSKSEQLLIILQSIEMLPLPIEQGPSQANCREQTCWASGLKKGRLRCFPW